jgi:hypothetical protein
MSTNKPQLKVYITPELNEAIRVHLHDPVYNKPRQGKLSALVENALWEYLRLNAGKRAKS